jgi:hypothetical protein
MVGISFLLVTLALSSAVFWFALVTAERLYYTGWASMQVETRRKKAARKAGSALFKPAAGNSRSPWAVLQRLLPAQTRAIMFKDAIEMRRDLRNLSQLVTPLIMGIVFSVMLLRGGGEPPPGRGEAPEEFIDGLRTFMAYGSMAISLFVGWTLLQRLALMSFSMESKSYWLLKSAPVSRQKLLAAKFLSAYLPALGVSWLFVFVIALLERTALPVLLYGLPAVALILAGVSGILLALGVRAANFDWTNPQRMVSGGMGCLAVILSLAYLGLAVFLFFAPPIAMPYFEIPEWTGYATGLLAGGAFALACVVLPLMLVMKRVDRLGEG